MILLTATQRKSYSSNLPIDAKISCYYSIKPPVVSESLGPSNLHVTTPQDTVDLTTYFPPASLFHSQIPVSTRVYPGAEPSHVPIPFQYGTDFNSQPEDNIFSLTNNLCQSCGRYDPPSSSTGSLSMECGVDPFQQLLDSNSQYFMSQPTIPYISNASSTFPGNSYDIYGEITGSSHLTMTANDETTLPSPNYDANNLHSYYMWLVIAFPVELLVSNLLLTTMLILWFLYLSCLCTEFS